MEWYIYLCSLDNIYMNVGCAEDQMEDIHHQKAFKFTGWNVITFFHEKALIQALFCFLFLRQEETNPR